MIGGHEAAAAAANEADEDDPFNWYDEDEARALVAYREGAAFIAELKALRYAGLWRTLWTIWRVVNFWIKTTGEHQGYRRRAHPRCRRRRMGGDAHLGKLLSIVPGYAKEPKVCAVCLEEIVPVPVTHDMGCAALSCGHEVHRLHVNE
eukprot:239375-Prymnesium_polylepis.1